jgi:hypothetical protein
MEPPFMRERFFTISLLPATEKNFSGLALLRSKNSMRSKAIFQRLEATFYRICTLEHDDACMMLSQHEYSPLTLAFHICSPPMIERMSEMRYILRPGAYVS